MKGKLILVIGPSGSGKSVLLAYLRTALPDIVFPVSYTTRLPRPGERDGVTYHFISEEEFQTHVAQGEFLEWANYGGNHYGTLQSQILPQLARGKVIVREMEVQGAHQVQKELPPEQLAIIFINAGSWEESQRRIRTRAPISDGELMARRRHYEDEMGFMQKASRVIENPDGRIEKAKEEFLKAVRELSLQ